MPATKQTQEKKADTISIECPVDKLLPGYVSISINTKLTSRQALALKYIWGSLSERGERYQGGTSSRPDGSPVESPNAGVRWMLDRAADLIEEKTGKPLAEFSTNGDH